MESALLLVALAVTAFAATNLDNLILLVGIASRPGQPFAALLAGALLTGAVMLTACTAVGLVADYAPPRWLGWLGLIPLAMGLRELARLVRASAEPAPDAASTLPAISAPGVAGIMLANSADSFGVLVPLFAETRNALLPLIGAVVLAMSALACVLARWLTRHPRIGPALRTVGPRVVPFVLIAVGLYVLSDTGTDSLLPGG